MTKEKLDFWKILSLALFVWVLIDTIYLGGLFSIVSETPGLKYNFPLDTTFPMTGSFLFASSSVLFALILSAIIIIFYRFSLKSK